MLRFFLILSAISLISCAQVRQNRLGAPGANSSGNGDSSHPSDVVAAAAIPSRNAVPVMESAERPPLREVVISSGANL